MASPTSLASPCEKKVQTLSDDLQLANTESEYFRQQWQDLRLRDEALGVDALDGRRTARLEDRLVEAVKELYQSEMRRREALLLLDRLRTTTEALLKTAPHYDPKVRADYEVAMRASRDYLAGPQRVVHSARAVTRPTRRWPT